MYIHTAWASALLVLTSWAMPEPRVVGRVTDGLPRSFCISVTNLCFTTMLREAHGVNCIDAQSVSYHIEVIN